MIKHSVSSLFVSGEVNVRAEGEDVASFGLPSVRQSTCAWATVDPPQLTVTGRQPGSLGPSH